MYMHLLYTYVEPSQEHNLLTVPDCCVVGRGGIPFNNFKYLCQREQLFVRLDNEDPGSMPTIQVCGGQDGSNVNYNVDTQICCEHTGKSQILFSRLEKLDTLFGGKSSSGGYRYGREHYNLIIPQILVPVIGYTGHVQMSTIHMFN